MPLKVRLTNTPHVIRKGAKEVTQYTMSASKTSTPGRAVFSEGANTCSLLALNLGNVNRLFHLAPELQPTNNLYEGIRSSIDTLYENSEDLDDEVTAVLIGGRELIKDNPESEASFNLYNETANVLEELEIPYTMICGKKMGLGNDDIYIADGTAHVQNDFFECLKGDTRSPQERIKEQLERGYQFVEIDPRVPIEVGRIATKKA